MNRKAQMMSPRKSISLILGFLILAVGGIQLLNKFNVVKFTIPESLSWITAILLLVGALFLFYSGYAINMGMPGPEMYMCGFAGLVALPFGLITVLQKFKIISFGLPAFAIAIAPWAFVLAGFVLIIAGLMGF